jgi:three-Cys-motif partner protein
MRKRPEFDQIGYWSEIKLAILREYAAAYARVLKGKLKFDYVDGFAGAGEHLSKTTGEHVPGSPLLALNVQPRFHAYHFVDSDARKVENLRCLVEKREGVFLHCGDSNRVLVKEILPRFEYTNYRRALCMLDPYGLTLDWSVVAEAGRLGTVDLLINFPLMDMNRNVLWHQPDRVSAEQAERMTRFWGDDTWRNVAYSTATNLFGEPEKQPNEVIADAYRNRLMQVGKFKFVPLPLPMRNRKRAIVYYLFFGSQVEVAGKIARAIFKKYSLARN